jgi:predicted nucleic acid-binding protein
MNYLVDTNILLRLADRNHSQHSIVRQSIRLLLSQEHDLYITPQNCAEFWNVATRPLDRNGLGLNVEKTAKILRLFERLFSVILDRLDIYSEWKRLVKTYRVQGVQVHDARLVAAMKTHHIKSILTFNVKDFKRYRVEEIKAVSPQDVCQ